MSTEENIPAACYSPETEEEMLPSIIKLNKLAEMEVTVVLAEEDIDESFGPSDDDLLMIDAEDLDRELE